MLTMTGLRSALDAVLSDRYMMVRRRIFRQLAEALLFEKVLPANREEAGEETMFTITGETEAGDKVTYTCWGKERLTFGRIRLSDRPILRTTGRHTEEAQSPTQFLLEIRHILGADSGLTATFIHELEQTQLNDTLAQHYRSLTASEPVSGRRYDEIEGDVTEGHLYHPSYKSRLGFDYEDQYQYGPEFKSEIRPVWVAARKSQTLIAMSSHLDYDEWLIGELGAEQLRSYEQRLHESGLSLESYVLLPVHPWQWQQRIVPYFLNDIREKMLVLLGPAEDAYRAQQSIRTLANATSPHKAYLKLAMNLINTSTGRVLAPHTVANAPLISDWLGAIAESDPYLKDELRLVLLKEFLGVSYDCEQRSELLLKSTYGSLGCIWRESVHTYFSEGEDAVPFTAFCSKDPQGRPFIDDWVHAFGLDVWLDKLLATSIPPILHLLYAHGIALESHAQNMVLIHRDGMPERIALKDFHDGVRFSRKHLAQPENCPNLVKTPEYHASVNRNSFIETDDTTNIRDLALGAFFFINLGELAIFAADHYGYSEAAFWEKAARVITDYQARFPEWRDRFELFDLFTPTNELEQLAKRRLFPESELRVHPVRNPLSICIPKE